MVNWLATPVTNCRHQKQGSGQNQSTWASNLEALNPIPTGATVQPSPTMNRSLNRGIFSELWYVFYAY